MRDARSKLGGTSLVDAEHAPATAPGRSTLSEQQGADGAGDVGFEPIAEEEIEDTGGRPMEAAARLAASEPEQPGEAELADEAEAVQSTSTTPDADAISIGGNERSVEPDDDDDDGDDDDGPDDVGLRMAGVGEPDDVPQDAEGPSGDTRALRSAQTATAASAPAPAPASANPLDAQAAVEHAKVTPPRVVSQSRRAVKGGTVKVNGKQRRYERRLGKATGVVRNKDARYNPHLNKPPLTNAAFHMNRPGVRVAGKDIYTLRAGLDTLTRYTENAAGVMEKADTIPAVNIASEIGHQTTALKKGRLALNPSKVRVRKDPDNPAASAQFVLAWFGIQGSAWVRVTDLAGNAADIIKAVNKAASKVKPAKAADVKGAAASSQRFKFAPMSSTRATIDTRDYQRYVLSNQKGYGNKVQDYLAHSVSFPDGSKRDYYNLCINLPSNHPPLAGDVVAPETPFFIAKGEQFVRETTTFAPKFKDAGAPVPLQQQRKSKLRMTWVYGFVGKQDPSGKIVPDANRGGWVPLRVLVKA